MGFYALNFIYDGIPASDYGLRISSLSDQGESVGASVELITQDIYRRPSVYLLGVKQTPVLNIPVTITVKEELSASQSSAISRWLFGQSTYKKLQIIQPDMEYLYYNCIFQNPSLIKVGNITRGFNATAVCDSPFAWEYPKKEVYTFNDYSVYKNITVNNTSDSSDYYYPKMEVRANIFGGFLEIINESDKSRVFGISDLQPMEELIIDNSLQTITNTADVNRISTLEGYGYKWFRYVPNANYLTVRGNIDYLAFISTFPKKIS